MRGTGQGAAIAAQGPMPAIGATHASPLRTFPERTRQPLPFLDRAVVDHRPELVRARALAEYPIPFFARFPDRDIGFPQNFFGDTTPIDARRATVVRLVESTPRRQSPSERRRKVLKMIEAVHLIVGESGSGKSTVARLIETTDGRILLSGKDAARMPARKLRSLRREVRIVFQAPYRSLNPGRTVGLSIIEGPMNHGKARGRTGWTPT